MAQKNSRAKNNTNPKLEFVLLACGDPPEIRTMRKTIVLCIMYRKQYIDKPLETLPFTAI